MDDTAACKCSKRRERGKNDLTRHFFTTNVKLRRLMRVRISHEMASRKMLKFSSLALNQIFDEFFFRRRREFLQIWKLRHGGPNSCVYLGVVFLVYNNKYIACEIFSELSIFSQKNKSKHEEMKVHLQLKFNFKTDMESWHQYIFLNSNSTFVKQQGVFVESWISSGSVQLEAHKYYKAPQKKIFGNMHGNVHI